MGAICESSGWTRAVVIWEAYVGYMCCTHGNIIKHQHVSHMAYGICDWYMALMCYPCGKGICESYMVSLYLSVPFFTWGSYGNSI
jgi:hypothetical protein